MKNNDQHHGQKRKHRGTRYPLSRGTRLPGTKTHQTTQEDKKSLSQTNQHQEQLPPNPKGRTQPKWQPREKTITRNQLNLTDGNEWRLRRTINLSGPYRARTKRRTTTTTKRLTTQFQKDQKKKRQGVEMEMGPLTWDPRTGHPQTDHKCTGTRRVCLPIPLP